MCTAEGRITSMSMSKRDEAVKAKVEKLFNPWQPT
jgi:hypothetical protein